MSHEVEYEEPAIYSPTALFWFSVVFGPLAGGIMAFQSLREVGQLRVAKYCLWTSIVYFGLLWIVGSLMPYAGLLSVVVGLIWGITLWYLLKKKVPDEASLPRRSIKAPLRICLYVVAGFIMLACVRIQLGL